MVPLATWAVLATRNVGSFAPVQPNKHNNVDKNRQTYPPEVTWHACKGVMLSVRFASMANNSAYMSQSALWNVNLDIYSNKI